MLEMGESRHWKPSLVAVRMVRLDRRFGGCISEMGC
jgi:hypothetical protein